MTTTDPTPRGLDRRAFLRAGGLTAGTTLLGGSALQLLTTRMAEAAPRSPKAKQADYGPLRPQAARNTGEQ